MRLLLHASFRTKLALAFAVALLPVLVLMVWGFGTDVRKSEVRILDDEQLAADAIAVQVEETFDAALGVAWAVANDPLSQTLDPERLDAHLKRLGGRHPAFETIAIFDANGLNRGWGSNNTPAEPRLNISDRSHFQAVMATNAPALSQVLELMRPAGVLGVVAAVPLRNEADQAIGVVVVAMTTAQLSKWYDESRLRPGQVILLADRTGRLAFHSTEHNLSFVQSGAFMNFPAIHRALSGTPENVAKFQSPLLKDERIGAFVPTRRYHWAVGVTMPRDVALGPVHAALRRQLMGLFATILLSGFIVTLLAQQLTSPLSRLRKHARAIGQGDLSDRVSVKTGDEFEELGDALNEMTQQIQSRDAHLRATEERFRATFEQAAVGIAHTTVDGCWLWVNDRLCEILGYSQEELVQHTFQEITHPDDQSRDVVRIHELLDGRFEKYALERRCRRKDGSFIWVNSTITLARNADGDPGYFILVIEDIQQRKQMEEDRQQLLQREQAARANAEAAIRAKDQLLSTVSHELRTPLTPVLAGLDLLDEESVFSRGAQACLKMIRGNIEMEARLVSDLLDLSRIQQAKLDLRRDTTNVHDLLRHVTSFFEHELTTKGIEVTLELDAQEHILFADPGRLQQVIWNLLSNAVKYTCHHGHITVHTFNEARTLKIEVRDTGIGITPEVMARLFNAFEQGEQTVTRRYGGLGLGLTISKALIHMHGGQLGAASDGAGKGSTFTITLPLSEARAAGKVPARGPSGKQPSHRRRILLVEDNPDTQAVLTKLLERSGHSVKATSSSHEALEAAQNDAYDLLVSDIGLPDASGWELMREMRKNHPMNAIAISGFGTPEDYAKSRDAGFARHLVKPINYQVLKDAIDEISE
ncbi:PAS domain S-box protein [Verrucomicrobiota bacterium sgz303538]